MRLFMENTHEGLHEGMTEAFVIRSFNGYLKIYVRFTRFDASYDL